MIFIYFFITFYLISGCIYLNTINKKENSDLKNIINDAFNTSDKLPVRIMIGFLGTLIIFILLLIMITIWPFVYLIRRSNEYKSDKNEVKFSIKEKNRINKLKTLYEKHKGFNSENLTSKIIERDDLISQELSSDFKTDTILYVAEEPNSFIESYLKKNYEEIKTRFLNLHPKDEVFKFVIPDSSIISNYRTLDLEKKFAYNFPSISRENYKKVFDSLNNASVYDFTKQLKKELEIDFPLNPGFFRLINKRDGTAIPVTFSYFELPSDSKDNLDKAIWYYLANLDTGNKVMFKLLTEYDLKDMGRSHELADFRFNYEAHKISKKIEESIKSLKLLGHENILLRSVLSNLKGYEIKKIDKKLLNTHGKKISKITIDKDFKIYLPDYNNLEIKIPALSKAIFLLFLKHPEGIILKHLSDHKTELIKIYQALSLRISYEEAIKSIEDLVNPLSNSINEKASRIKGAFVKHFSEDISRNYYITGDRGERKGITLNRSFVNWKVDVLDWPFLKSKSTELSQEQGRVISSKYSKALDFISKKDYLNAKLQLSDIIELNQTHYDAYRLRAICNLELLQYDEAEKDNTKAIKLNPVTSISYHNRAEARFMLGKYTEALEDITKYLREVDNKCAESYYIRGLIYFEQDSEKAKQDFVNAKKLGHKEVTKLLKQCKGKIPLKTALEQKE